MNIVHGVAGWVCGYPVFVALIELVNECCTRILGSRPEDARAALVDQFYQRYEDRVAADPTGHAMDYVHCYLAIEKIS